MVLIAKIRLPSSRDRGMDLCRLHAGAKPQINSAQVCCMCISDYKVRILASMNRLWRALYSVPSAGSPQAQQREDLPDLDQRGGPHQDHLHGERWQHEEGVWEVLQRAQTGPDPSDYRHPQTWLHVLSERCIDDVFLNFLYRWSSWSRREGGSLCGTSILATSSLVPLTWALASGLEFTYVCQDSAR